MSKPRREYDVYLESELSLGIACGELMVPPDAEVFKVREVLPEDVEILNLRDLPELTDEENMATEAVHDDWDAFFRWRKQHRENRDDIKDRLPIVFNGKSVEEWHQGYCEQARKIERLRGLISDVVDNARYENEEEIAVLAKDFDKLEKEVSDQR